MPIKVEGAELGFLAALPLQPTPLLAQREGGEALDAIIGTVEVSNMRIRAALKGPKSSTNWCLVELKR